MNDMIPLQFEMLTFLNKLRKCKVCTEHLPLGPRPVVQLSPLSKIIIIGQAPGRRVHKTGIPWNDASGNKLREWMDVGETCFYDPDFFFDIANGALLSRKGQIRGSSTTTRMCSVMAPGGV